MPVAVPLSSLNALTDVGKGACDQHVTSINTTIVPSWPSIILLCVGFQGHAGLCQLLLLSNGTFIPLSVTVLQLVLMLVTVPSCSTVQL